jgi:predicted amidophosphoribosyltransferase
MSSSSAASEPDYGAIDVPDLDYLRANGLCSMCREPLTEKEKALEGVGGSYVRCDECVQEIQRNGPEFVGGPIS